MNPFKKAYCRTFQFFLKVALPFLPYRNPKILAKVEANPLCPVPVLWDKEKLAQVYRKVGGRDE